jgi:hypothetical protein
MNHLANLRLAMVMYGYARMEIQEGRAKTSD